MKARRRHPIWKGAFWFSAGLLMAVFVFAPLALTALSAALVIVPTLPFVIVPFMKGTWQGRSEPEHARFHVLDVTPQAGRWPAAQPAHA